MTKTTRLACACGCVQMEADERPIIATECHCNSCHAAGERLRALEGAPDVRGRNGGTPFVLYRKDRVRFVTGLDRLRAFRLTQDASTRRAVATCCNTPMFLEFKGGHWLSVYAALWPDATRPAINIRTMTGDRAEAAALSQDVPHGTRQTLGFYARLLGAWAAMGFRSPDIAIKGEINA
jgi:hypothetical protein